MSIEIEPHELPEWARELGADIKKNRPPSYVKLLNLPPLVPLHSPYKEYDFEVLGGFLALLSRTFMNPHEPVPRVISECTPESCAGIGRALLDVWANKGHTMTYKWLLWSQVPLGGVDSVLELERLVEEWVFGTSAQRDRACQIIRVLGKMASPEALTVIGRYRQIERSPKVHGAALQAFSSAARALDLTDLELEDRIVPDYGLDARGRRVFDYGARTFELVFRENLYPALRDEDGKVHKSPPRARKSDDRLKVEQVKRAWSDLNEHLKRAGRVHRTRVERYMVSGRRWRADEWDTAIRTHPFMQHFARNLLWGIYDPQTDALTSTFCVSNDLSVLDRDDDEVTLSPTAHVGVVHPIDLDNSTLTAWSNLFAEDERFEPFEQLGRTVYALERDEAPGNTVTRFADRVAQPRALRTYFKYQGFHRGNNDDYLRTSYWKELRDGGWSYTVHLSPGLNVGSYEGDVEQVVSQLTFSNRPHGSAEPIHEVPACFISEALRDIERILSRS